MGSLKIDAQNNLVREGGAFVRLADDDPANIVQAVNVRIQRFTKENPHNLAEGTRWLELILGNKGVPSTTIAQHLRKRISETPGIEEITELTITNDGRKALVTWRALASIADYKARIEIGSTVELPLV